MVGIMLAFLAVGANSVQANYWDGGNSHYVTADGGDKSYRKTQLYWGNWTCYNSLCSLPVQEVKAYTNIMSTSYQYDYESVWLESWNNTFTRIVQVTLNYWNTPGASVTWALYAIMDDGWQSGVDVTTSVCDDNDCTFFPYQGAYDVVHFNYNNNNNPSQSEWGTNTSFP